MDSLKEVSGNFLVDTVAAPWVAVLAVFSALIFLGMIAAIILARGRDIQIRVTKCGVVLFILALVFFPALVVVRDVDDLHLGAAVLLYMFFLSLFLYYLGKKIGETLGKRHISELLGMDSPESTADTQERLFESRMRLPASTEVVKSISEMLKEREADRLANASNQLKVASSQHSITDVMVEDV